MYFRGLTAILPAWSESGPAMKTASGRARPRKGQVPAMKNFYRKSILPFVIFALGMMLAPPSRAQDLGSITRITPIPDGAMYSVDGQVYSHATSAVWPSGSKHILAVPMPAQAGPTRTQYSFNHWEFAGGSLLLNPLAVTASPDIPEYQAVFDVLYGLGLRSEEHTS